MGSYYYTAADKALITELAAAFKGRLVFNPLSKQGHKWKLDGNVVSIADLVAVLYSAYGTERDAMVNSGDWKSPRYRAIHKLGSQTSIRGILVRLQTPLMDVRNPDRKTAAQARQEAYDAARLSESDCQPKDGSEVGEGDWQEEEPMLSTAEDMAEMMDDFERYAEEGP